MAEINHYGYPHRTYCDCLHDLRQIIEAHIKANNLTPSQAGVMSTLVEELQVYGNRMETALSYGRDLDHLHKKRKELIKEIRDEAEGKWDGT